VAATDQIVGKPYKWNGGHHGFEDAGYDCSGTICYFLHAAGAIPATVDTKDLLNWGSPGRGRWVTVYVRPHDHVFAEVGNARLDTTDLATRTNIGPRWFFVRRSTVGYEARTFPGW